LDSEFPKYLWSRNVGYGTADHISAIREIGITKHHRKSFCQNFI
jgi:ribonuclease HII